MSRQQTKKSPFVSLMTFYGVGPVGKKNTRLNWFSFMVLHPNMKVYSTKNSSANTPLLNIGYKARLSMLNMLFV